MKSSLQSLRLGTHGYFGRTISLALWLAFSLFAADIRPGVLEQNPTRNAFLKIIDRPKVALAPEVGGTTEAGNLSQLKFSYATDASQRVPGVLVKQSTLVGRRPVVIVLHGTGGNKEGQVGLLRLLAAKGFVGIAIDGRYHGERSAAGKGTADYTAAIVRTYDGGKEHPFYYDTVWDVMRLIDYLETRDDVDARRIGLIGFSKGGIETYMTAAAEPRISVAVPCIGVQSFAWALEHNAWKPRVGTIQSAFTAAAREAGATEPDSAFVRQFYDRVAPGIYSQFDGPAMLTCIAPRPLLVINGDSDDKTPIPGLELCTAAARTAYTTAGAAERFSFILQEKTGHKVTDASRDTAIEWFTKWLKP